MSSFTTSAALSLGQTRNEDIDVIWLDRQREHFPPLLFTLGLDKLFASKSKLARKNGLATRFGHQMR